MVNFVLAQAVLDLIPRRWQLDGAPARNPLRVRRWSLAAGIVVVAWTALSLGLYSTASTSALKVRVAAIQPNLPRAAHLDKETSQETRLDTLGIQTRDAAARGAQLIVWPELGLGFDPQTEHSAELRALAAETGAYIVIGYGLETGEGFRNEATVLTPEGRFLGIYGKAHPVVFGGEPYGINAGTFPVYDTPLATLATIICYDLDFTDPSRKLAAQGAQVIGVPSLDFPGIAELHYTQMTFRAVENRVAMVKADTAHDSAIIDPYGHTVAWVASPEATRTTVIAEVPLGTGGTLYSRLGNWIGWLALAGMVFFMVPNPIVRPRKKPAAE